MSAALHALAGILHSAFPEEWRNPSSAYKFSSKHKRVLGTAQPREIFFTSCATESNNAAIHAALKANPGKRHIVTQELHGPGAAIWRATSTSISPRWSS